MKELKVKFKRLDNIVLLKVVQRDEKSNTDTFEFINNRFMIECKQKTFDVINIMNIYSDNVIEKRFETPKRAKDFIKRAKECIKAYNDSIKVKEDKTFPQMGDTYYHSFGTWEILDTTFDDGKIDKYFQHINNFWETKEECKRYNEIKQKEMELIHRFTKEDYKKEDICKYIIDTCHTEESLSVAYHINYQDSSLSFKTEEDAKAFADFCGYEDYCKFVLGAK